MPDDNNYGILAQPQWCCQLGDEETSSVDRTRFAKEKSRFVRRRRDQ